MNRFDRLDDERALDEDLEDEPDFSLDEAEGDSAPTILPRGTDRAVATGSLDELEDGDEEPIGQYGDDVIAARVRRLLRSDVATSMLRVRVEVEDGLVTLRGMVQTLEDTDNAAEVASRVPGVLDVIDELEVED